MKATLRLRVSLVLHQTHSLGAVAHNEVQHVGAVCFVGDVHHLGVQTVGSVELYILNDATGNVRQGVGHILASEAFEYHVDLTVAWV